MRHIKNDANTNAAIVIIAFDRAKALSRLLNSLARADYQDANDISLVISIDNGGPSEVNAIADEFIWEYGSKRIIKHQQRLGLREHVLFCGDLSKEYGAVVVLEDDLFVSPYFYEYVNSSISFFRSNERVCQISLYSPQVNEFARRSFTPVVDGYDNYFIQSASSWGQIWTDESWKNFREWYFQIIGSGKIQWTGIPYIVEKWPASSWKKYYIKYMHERNLYTVYPRTSLTTNWGDDGEHMQTVGSRFQVPLLLTSKIYRFSDISESSAVYDSFFEPSEKMLIKLAPCLNKWKRIEADFYGLKRRSDVSAEFLISVKNCTEAVSSFGEQMKPPINNIVFEIPGESFRVGKASSFNKLSYIIRLRIILDMMSWVGFGGLLNGLKRRIRKYISY